MKLIPSVRLSQNQDIYSNIEKYCKIDTALAYESIDDLYLTSYNRNQLAAIANEISLLDKAVAKEKSKIIQSTEENLKIEKRGK